jgi:hypothetical protein
MGLIMRRGVFWPVFLLPLTFACSAILGDFTVGTGDGGPDTGGDVAPPNDGGPDVSPQDAGDGEAGAPKTMKCGEDKNARVMLNAADGKLPWDLVQVAQINQTHVRVVASEASLVYSYTLDANHQVAGTSSSSTGANQVLDITRLPDRFIAVTSEYDSNNKQVFGLYTIKDSDSVFTHDILTQESQLSSDADRIQAQVIPYDIANGVYFLVVYDAEGGDSKAILRAGLEKVSAPGTLTIVDTSQPVFKYELRSPAVASDPQNAFVLIEANGPSTNDSLLYTITMQQVGAVQPRALTPQNGATYFPMAFGNSPQQGLVDMGFIEANLNTLSGAYHVGQVQLPKMGSFDPSTLPTSIIPLTDSGAASIPDLMIDKAQAHMEYFPTPMSESLLVLSRTSDLNGPLSGYNFEWWDLTNGNVRCRQTGATNLLNDITQTYRANVSFQAPPLGALAQFHMAFEDEPNTSNQNQPGNLWYTTLSCVLQ